MPEDEPHRIPTGRKLKNRPVESRWRQQHLPAYRPVYNARCAFPVTLLLGLLFGGVGVLLQLTISFQAHEHKVNYTDCQTSSGESVGHLLDTSSNGKPLFCTYRIQLNTNFTGTVKFFYALDNFFQNSRLYFQSRDDNQLYGDVLSAGSDCKPLDKRKDDSDGIEKPIAPCGFIADSMFNDTFTLVYHPVEGKDVDVPFTVRNMVSTLMKTRKFKNPPVGNGTLCDAFAGTVRPRSWRLDVCELGRIPVGVPPNEDLGRAFENIDFIVWMTPAALPSFRKPFRLLDTTDETFRYGLPAGNYTLKITFNYPVNTWNGVKYFIISSDTWVSGMNPFLAIAYMTVGVFLLLVSVIFFVICMLQNRIIKKRASTFEFPTT